MKNKLLSQLYESCKKWKTLVLLGVMLLIGINTVWADNIPAGTIIYVDVTNFSTDQYFDGYFLSIVHADNKDDRIDKYNTSGASSYAPKNDNWDYRTLTRVGSTNIYYTTITSGESDAKISIWSKYLNNYNDCWEVNVAGNIAYESGKNLIEIESGYTTNKDKHTRCFSATWSTFDICDAFGYAPSAVLNKTNVMFYIQSYSNPTLYLTNGTTTNMINATYAGQSGYGYINTAKSNLSTYNHISNSPTWGGNECSYINENIGGGGLYRQNGSSGKTDSTAASTSVTPSNGTLSISTTCSAATGVFNSKQLYIQYYIDGTFVGVTHGGSTAVCNSITASTSAKASTYDISGLSAGSHTLLTILTDGNIFYIADEDSFMAGSTPSISLEAPSTAVRGNSITLEASTNQSTPTIYYEYSTNSTFASSVTEINSTTSTSQSWTVPEGTSGTTYYLRAKMQISSTWYYSDILTLTAYGKKTIKVKNTNGWGTFKLYCYSDSGEREAWSGSTTGVSSAGGQWKQVELTSQWPYFILTDGTNQIKGSKTYTYAGVTDGNCYAISSGSGSSLTLDDASCPTAPTGVTTTATPTSSTNARMTVAGSISTNGNDAITDYGFYYGTSATPGTQARIATSDHTGSISKEITGLTAGTTYYFKAYATNGQGTSYGDVESYKLPYAVTVSTNTGCSEITNEGTNYTNSTITVTATKATGYTFSSWSTTKGTQTSTSSTETTNTLTFTPTANNATIQPVYTENTFDVTVTKTPSAGGSVTPTSVTAMGVVTGGNITASNNSGYAFSGWSITSGSGYFGASGTSTTSATANTKFRPTADATILATFTPNDYTVTLNDNGGSGGDGTLGVTFDAATGSLTKTPTKSGYNFGGYWTNADGTGVQVFDANGAPIKNASGYIGNNDSKTWIYAGNPTLYAKWTQTVVLDANTDHHGVAGDGSAVVTYNGISSSVSGFSATTAATGYQLEGFYAAPTGNDKVLNSNGTYASDNVTGFISSGKWTKAGATTLYAHYTAKTYTITLNANGGSSNGSATATYNSNKLTSISEPSKSGYSVLAYYKEPGMTNLVADAGGNLQPNTTYTDASGNWTSDGNQTLYAKWGLQVPETLKIDGPLSNGPGVWSQCCTMTKKGRTFTYTIYDLAAGSYEFCFKDASCNSTALLKPNMAICDQTKNAGNIPWADAGGDYHNFTITTTAKYNVTVTVEYGETTALVTVNSSSPAATLTSNWYMIGEPFNNWNTDNHDYPLNHSYRGISKVYYRVVNFNGSNQYFRPLKNNTGYGQSTGSDVEVDLETPYAISAKMDNGTAFKAHYNHQVYCVVDETNSKFWVQNAVTYYTVTVDNQGSHGTVTLKEQVYDGVGNYETNQYAEGEAINVSITANTGYYIDDISFNGEPVETNYNDASYEGTLTMPDRNATLTVTYVPISYTITYNPATPSNFEYTVQPASGSYNTTVSITVTPNQDYKITSVTANKTGAAGTSVTVSHTTATLVYTFTQPAYGVTFNVTSAAYGLTATANPTYESKTVALGYTSTLTPEGTKGTNWFVNYVCTSKPDGSACAINQSTGVATVDKDGSYTFKVQFRTAADGGGTLLAESSGQTITMKTIPDYSSLTPTTAIIGTSYMNGSGTSVSPYFVYSSHFNDAKTLTLNVSGVGSTDDVYCAVDDANEQSMTGSGTSRTATITLPSGTIGANKTTDVTVYAKVDGQTPAAAKKALLTVYYTVHADPVVTVTATYLGEEVESAIPQSATIVLSASVTNIPGESTFTYNKGDGDYSSTTSYTINEVGTTKMHAKTSYLGDWIGTKSITTYTANSVRFVILKTDMYGDNDSIVTSRLFNSDGESFTAPSVSGYTFSSWTCRGANVRVSDDDDSWNTSSTEETVKVKATATGSALVANYDEVKRIYFDNSKAKWSGDIYVYLFSGDAWYNDYNSGNDNGPGVVPRLDGLLQACGQMTKIGESDIYYYEYTTPYAYVAFSIGDQHTYGHLYDTKGVWRTDFSSCNPCYVAPENSDQTKYDHGNNKPTYYYNNGYWRRYMPAYAPYSIYVTGSSPSRTLSGDQGKFTPENTSVDAENFVKDLLLDGGTTYWFNLPSSCGGSYGNNGEITKDNHTNFTFVSTSGGTVGNCRITTTAGGTYKFHLSTANGQIKLSVDYPLSEGDYRVLYSDNTGNNENTSNYIRKNTGEDAKDDIVSFFVKANAEPTFTIERCSGFEGNTPTWETAVAATGISVAKDSVYNFTFTQPAGGLTISKTAQGYYSGHYYIRTDGAAGGWANYLSNPDNIMKHTEKASAEAAGYNYYYLRWIGDANGNSTTNVKYCVATDYNDCVSQEFGNDPISGSLSGGQALTGKGANVRFTYHAGTNNMTRTYVGGSGHDNQYLVVNGTNLKKSDGTEWSGRTKMTDLNDWIYTFELKAKDGATISLESHYNDKYVTILPSETVLEVSNDDYYGLRIVYDYKTNEIVAAYIPSTVDDVLDVDVDIMFIRKALDNKPDAVAPTTTLTLTGNGKITGEPKTLYGAIEFEKDFVRAEGLYSGLSANRPERSTYWISFPFDVQVKDIFGLGEYTDTWILQRYRGDLRASKGWFLDTKTFWEYILDKDYVLQAGQGYVLSLDCEAIQWPHNQTTQYLYFPSKDKITDITSVLPSASMDVPEHICSITSPADRTIKDAHWNVIGVPGFNDAWGRATETVTVSGGDLRYFYTWDSETNTLSTTSARNYEFKFMHSYMVQYYGNIDWSASEPALAPARRSADAKPEVVEFRIDIKQGDVKKDNTFVTLMDNDKITNGFDMNADLVKMYNANQANIYTIINDVEVSANCLPMTDQTTIVPVGVKIVANGDYTFSIPEGTEGIGVTLIDNETGIRTSLSALDYTIHLSAGTYDNRFVLEISPVAQMPTDIENTDASVHDGIRKVMIDGILYIVRGNKIFDARGNRVK